MQNWNQEFSSSEYFSHHFSLNLLFDYRKTGWSIMSRSWTLLYTSGLLLCRWLCPYLGNFSFIFVKWKEVWAHWHEMKMDNVKKRSAITSQKWLKHRTQSSCVTVVLIGGKPHNFTLKETSLIFFVCSQSEWDLMSSWLQFLKRQQFEAETMQIGWWE